MKQVNLFFVMWWMAVSSSFSLTWSSSINNIFSAKDFLELTTGADHKLRDAIGNGAQMAINECQIAFQWDRWNCPETEFSKKKRQHVTKEQAVIQTILSAGITYTIAKNCSQGVIQGCGCNAKIPKYSTPYTKENYIIEKKRKVAVDFVLKQCEADINFAETVSKNILDRQITGNDIQAKINLHNYNVGRMLIKENLVQKCRCHGVSGSCTVQTCWMELAPFSKIAKQIRDKYRHSKGIKLVYNNRMYPQNFEKEMENRNKAALIFSESSEEKFCFPNNITGWPGTKGRSCSRIRHKTTTIEERKSCRNLCKTCGYKVRRVKRLKTWSCKCQFKWCCEVECQTCNEIVDEFYCH